MPRPARLAIALVVALAAAPAARATDFTPLETVVKAEIAAAGIPGAVVVVVQGDRVTYAKGFGVASVETGEPVTPDHLFRVGSTTKVFVGAALAKLAEAGKLTLDAPVGALIDGLPPGVAKVTPHQLLTHTAGLADGNAMFGRHDDDALGAGIRAWTDGRLFTRPGDVYSYSNPGYWLAGFAAERAAGKPFADVLADELFRPLGMRRTTFRPTLAMTYPLAQGHESRAGKPAVVRPAADNAATWPAGSMYTSGTDLARFVVAFLNGGTLDGQPALSASLLRSIAAPHAALPGGRGHYGYGLMRARHRGVELVSHGGSRAGYGSRLVTAPEHKFGLVLLMNRTGATLPKTEAKVLELALPLGPAEKPEAGPKPTPGELATLAGVYRNGAVSIELTWAGGLLTAPGGAVEPLGGARFQPAGGDPFELVTGADGTTRYLVRGGRAYKKQDRGNPVRYLPPTLLPALAAAPLLAGPAALPAPPMAIAPFFAPPPKFAGDLGSFRSPLQFADGAPVKTAADWPRRRQEILDTWHGLMGPWPPPVENPTFEIVASEKLDGYIRHKVKVQYAPGHTYPDAYYLVPDGPGPFPAVIHVSYGPLSAVGLSEKSKTVGRAVELARRGFAGLSVGGPNHYYPTRAKIQLQPLSFHAYVASTLHTALARRPEVDPARIRKPGITTDDNPRTGAYRRMREAGRDLHELHALMAPRPFLVSGGSEDPPERWRAINHAVAVNRLLGAENRVAMTNRPTHAATEESNNQIYEFCEWALKGKTGPR